MGTTTLVGVFDDDTHAQAASRELVQIGVSQGDISVAKSDYESGYSTSRGGTSSSSGGGISGFFSNLFGSDVDEDDRGLYSEAVRRGSTVLTADVDESLVDRASDILNRHGVVDIDRRAAQYRATGYSAYDETAPIYSPEQRRAERERYGTQGDVALPVIEEQLQVGKRAVQRGGVRIHTRVTDRPVEEHVTLREERVQVERRPVDRAVTDADLAAMKDGVVEVTTTGEEAVVGKQSRVVEEVVVGKDVVEREETVRDTVRRTDVDVENVGTNDTTARKGRTRT